MSSSERRIGFSGAASGVEGDAEASQWLDAARRALPPGFGIVLMNHSSLGIRRDDVASVVCLMRWGRSSTRAMSRAESSGLRHRRLDQLGGFDAALGARPMRRVIGRLVESPLAARMLRGDFDAGDVVEVVGKGGDVVLRRGRDEAAAGKSYRFFSLSKSSIFCSRRVRGRLLRHSEQWSALKRHKSRVGRSALARASRCRMTV